MPQATLPEQILRLIYWRNHVPSDKLNMKEPSIFSINYWLVLPKLKEVSVYFLLY